MKLIFPTFWFWHFFVIRASSFLCHSKLRQRGNRKRRPIVRRTRRRSRGHRSKLQLTHGIPRIFYLLTDGCEEPAYSRQAHMICDERWKEAAAVSVNGISGVSPGYALRFKEPFALANFYPHYAFRFWRAEVVRWRPLTHKDETIRGRP